MTIPPRFSESNRPEDFNIPSDVSDSFFRQITKLVPGTSSAHSKGHAERSDLSSFDDVFNKNNFGKDSETGESIPEHMYPVYERHPIFNDQKENYLTTPQAGWWKKLRARMGESWSSGERGAPGYQQHADDSHHNGHWATHMDNKTAVMHAYDEYLDLRHDANKYVNPFTGEYFGSQELYDQLKPAREKVDSLYQKMHDHLHGTCYRSEAKGGPCGFWGIPRGKENCDFCRAGNPVRMPGDEMRLASKDPWEVEDGDDYKRPVTPPRVTEEDRPGFKRTEVPEDIKSSLSSEDPGAEAAYKPLAEPWEAERMQMAQDPEVKHWAGHIQLHNELFSQATVLFDQYSKAREHYANLEELAGEHPDERQEALLAKHRAGLVELHDAAHDAWHTMHTNLHTECPDCRTWAHPRGHECPHCVAGCPLCHTDDPRRLSSKTSWS